MASDFGPRIADLVEVAATRLPEAPALVVTADRIAISHRDLARLVDELAGQLTRRRAGPESAACPCAGVGTSTGHHPRRPAGFVRSPPTRPANLCRQRHS